MNALLPQLPLYLVLVIAAGAALTLALRPGLAATREGKVFAVGALLLLPLAALGMGGVEQLQRSEQTRFCLSCHVMAPWGKSLQVDDPKALAAAHYQNHRVPADEACYTCHTDYGQFGTLRAKLEGLHHVYVQYFSQPMDPIRLYHPFNNRECLHCHAGARSFVDDPVHAAMMSTLVANQLSCVSSGCHDLVHEKPTPGGPPLKYWAPPQP